MSSSTSKSKSRWVGTATTVTSTSSKSPKGSISEPEPSEEDTVVSTTGKQLSEIMKGHLNMKESEYGNKKNP